MTYLFRNLSLLDPRFEETRDGYEVLVEGGHFKEVSDRPIKSSTAHVIDCGGGTLMPGLIDCHVHVYLSEVNMTMLELQDQGAHLALIMQQGRLHKYNLK